MPRKRTVPDEVLLSAALSIVRAAGPDSLSFGSLAARVDLAASTLVQRFGSRADLLRAALLLAWDRLDEQTARACAEAPSGVPGVVDLFVRLSGQYDSWNEGVGGGAGGDTGGSNDADDYADQLMLLREDLRDPVLRARGQAWIDTLAAAVEERLEDAPGEVPGGVSGLGELVVAQWQGSLTVWGFRRRPDVATAVRSALDTLLARISAAS
ncbi:DNA-binding transcriptional regulator, AcrR family [Actinopolymorpha cephalotaxi]|uniref:AcrR family transcriptional regulator n=1 Tax=Actinopolymorpha cephalotaxi TaxID=504797 RepID=A0A1I3APM6_9ACTN|nr:TetR family transcriptional regulator [Actinopolymorpha cephalotaxi]NYH85989.1 AcrR family transcriptional regulator [Actinopolymorpha cephalotaxi]SFH51746.1 DNA-binding transcriptional regulator, AcrR family [Actinopolymorpha cephalotaxi]